VLVGVPVIPKSIAIGIVALRGDCGHTFGIVIAGKIVALRALIFKGIVLKVADPQVQIVVYLGLLAAFIRSWNQSQPIPRVTP